MSDHTPSLRSVRSRREAVRVFARQPSPRILAAGLAAALAMRGRDRRVDRRDALVVGMVVATQGVHEWVIHRGLLHAQPRTVRGIVVDPGVGHRAHHRDPDVIDDALLKPRDAAQFLAMLALYVGVACRPWHRQLAARNVLSAIGAAYAALLRYEWTHFVDHTSVPLTSRRSRALRAHHRLHHYRDERMWLGITGTSGDRIFRTRPATPAEQVSAVRR